MSELVKDPAYRQFLITKPKMPKHLRDPKIMATPPWTVYVQKKADGPWGKKEFWKYSEALKFFNKAVFRVKVHDATINNKRIGYDPPGKLVRIKGKFQVGSDGVKRQVTKYIPWRLKPELMLDQPEHHWCKYCRRPTVFKYYSRHKRLGAVTTDVLRCCICGASARIAVPKSDPLYRRH